MFENLRHSNTFMSCLQFHTQLKEPVLLFLWLSTCMALWKRVCECRTLVFFLFWFFFAQIWAELPLREPTRFSSRVVIMASDTHAQRGGGGINKKQGLLPWVWNRSIFIYEMETSRRTEKPTAKKWNKSSNKLYSFVSNVVIHLPRLGSFRFWKTYRGQGFTG